MEVTKLSEENVTSIFTVKDKSSKMATWGRKQAEVNGLSPDSRWFLTWLILRREDGGDIYLRNVGSLSVVYKMLYVERSNSS
jgi:hypothetical protein